MTVRTIFHAHHWPFARIRERLPELARAGYDGVQLSPAQKSPPGNEWYLRYQPFDHLEIHGLGDRQELTLLCGEARALGVTIIADVVFNHMAVPPGARREHWVAAEAQRLAGDSRPMEALYAKLSWFPHLTREDFAPWSDMQGAAWDDERRYESWGNGEWPELQPTANVLRLHASHLQLLYDCGVRGFRFDAVKHMRPDHVSGYLRVAYAFPEACWCYGEILAGGKAMHREYDGLFPTTDFPFILHLKSAFAAGLPVHLDPDTAFLSRQSIRFGNNHDLACNPAHVVAGLLFPKPEQTRLANCLALLLDGGTSLIFADDHERDGLLRACVAFRHEHGGLAGPVVVRRQGRFGWSVTGDQAGVLLDPVQGRLTPAQPSRRIIR